MPTYVTFQTTTIASPPNATKVAVDNDGTGDWQYVKIVYGADGTRTPVSTTNRLPVKIGDGTDDLAINADGSINVSGTIEATTAKGSKTMSDEAPTDASATSILAANAARIVAIILNNSDGVVYVGASGVSSTTGIPLAAGQAITDTSTTDAWYARCATGVTGDMRIIEVE